MKNNKYLFITFIAAVFALALPHSASFGESAGVKPGYEYPNAYTTTTVTDPTSVTTPTTEAEPAKLNEQCQGMSRDKLDAKIQRLKQQQTTQTQSVTKTTSPVKTAAATDSTSTSTDTDTTVDPNTTEELDLSGLTPIEQFCYVCGDVSLDKTKLEKDKKAYDSNPTDKTKEVGIQRQTHCMAAWESYRAWRAAKSMVTPWIAAGAACMISCTTQVPSGICTAGNLIAGVIDVSKASKIGKDDQYISLGITAATMFMGGGLGM